MQSLRRHHPEARRVIVLADWPRHFPGIDLAADLVGCQELGIPLLENMLLWYSILELNTAIKPYVFTYFLKSGANQICYLDPDIYVYRPLQDAFTALRTYEAVLTPHLLEPQGDQKEPSDLTILKSGVYNLGFLAVRNTPGVHAMLQWWADRNFTHCRVDIAGHMFTDQRWMDLAPSFLSRPKILRHPGYNVAYWNIAKRALRQRKTRWLALQDELIFFHFSGLNPGDPESFSKHQNRLAYNELGKAAGLVDAYRARVLANGWRQSNRIPYGFATFQDGRPIEPTMRRWILRAIDENQLPPFDRLNLTSDFFDQPDRIAAAAGAHLTRFMYQYWLDRPDVRAAFDILTPMGLAGYFAWFVRNAAAEGIATESVRAARCFTQSGSAAHPTDPVKPPWTPLADRSWPGPSTEVETHLSGDVVVSADGFRLPVQLALLWERRSDLRDMFDLRDPQSLQDYVTWGFSEGVLQKAFDPSLLSDAFIAYFTDISVLQTLYSDVPITRGMLITQSITYGNPLLDAGKRFPAEAKGRIAHGLWFAFIAPRLYDWPLSLVKPVRDYFQQLTDVMVDGLQLTRGALAVWELHANLQKSFPLVDELSVLSYCRWLWFDGLPQLGLTLDDLDPRLRYFLTHRSPRLPDLTRLAELAHGANTEVCTRFRLTSKAGRVALSQWVVASLSTIYPHLAPPPSRASSSEDRATIGLTGLWDSASGRGEDVRCSARALDAVGFRDYRIVDLRSGRIIDPDGKVIPRRSLRVDINIVHHNADTAFEDWLALRARGVSATRTIGFWAWELERLPQAWYHAFSFFDEIWAATRFAYRAFYHPRLRPVRLVPMAVVPMQRKVYTRRRLDIPDKCTMFLFTFDYRSYVERKNPAAVIEAFARAFPSGREAVALVIKTLGAEATPAARHALEAVAAGDRRIHLIDTTLSRGEVTGLLAAADAFVSLHRSEGFGRGPAEAMLLGVPVIVTGYSGTADFATSECALTVPYRLVPVAGDAYPGVEGQRWAAPDIDAAARHMRFVHDKPRAAKALGARGRKQIRRLYDSERVGQRMLSVLQLKRVVDRTRKSLVGAR